MTMIDSLFGDLAPRRWPSEPSVTECANGDIDISLDDARLGATLDVLVEQSPADAMRSHFAAGIGVHAPRAKLITLIDPSQLWAPQVIRTLADAAARPVERLNLREHATLRTLALISRTTVPRLNADPLKVMHAELRVPGQGCDEIDYALAEVSALTAVVVGAMLPHASAALLRSLLQAAHHPNWRCPWLVFVLPPGATELAAPIAEQAWPISVRTLTVPGNDGSPSGLWNSVLDAWQRTRGESLDEPSADAAAAAALQTAPHAAASARRPTPMPAKTASAKAPGPDPTMLRLLAALAHVDGVLACAIVDLDSGDTIATHSGSRLALAHGNVNLAAALRGLCAARAAHGAALPGALAPDELLVTSAGVQSLLRALPGQPRLGFAALLERGHANLALLRFRLLAELGG